MPFSLKLKVALGATLMVAAAIGSVGVVRHQQLREDVIRIVAGEQDALANSLARDLADKLELHVGVLEQTALLTDVFTLEDESNRQAFMVRISTLKSLFNGLAIIGPNGDIVLTEPPSTERRVVNVADREYFQQAMSSRHAIISNPLVARTGSTPLVVIAVPVLDKDGQPIAVLAGGLNLERKNLLGRMNEQPVGQTGHIEVATRGPQGVFVVHPQRDMLLKPATLDGRQRDNLVSTVALRNVEWELRAVLPAWEASAPAVEAQRRLIKLLMVLGGIAAVVAWVGAYWLIRPLSQLVEAIQVLRRSPDQPVHLNVRSNDEQGRLAREFQSLIQELQTHQQELAVIGAAAPVGLFRTNTEGDITWANEAFLQIHGLDASQLARGWVSLVPAERRASMWQEWVKIVSAAKPHRVQMSIQRPDGVKRTLVIHSAPVQVLGRLNGHVGSVADVTDRVEGERAQRMLSTVLAASTDYVVQTNAKGEVIYMNPAALGFVGLTASEAPQHHFNEFNTPETSALFEREILPAVKETGFWLGDTTIYNQRREAVPVSHLVIAHRNKDGRVERFSAIMRNVSKQREAQRELERQTATLQSMAESIPAIVAVVGADQRYRFVNAAYENWHNCSRDQVLGRTLLDVIGEPDYSLLMPWITRALAGETVQFERENGEQARYKYLSVSCIPLRLADGEIDGFVSVAMDISQQRQKENLLTQLAQKDALTGLLNRAGFEAHLDLCLQQGQGETLALLYIDLDHFKPVNDTYGHPVGDQLLRLVAQRLRAVVRPSDAVARLGGDEFALVLSGVRSVEHANRVAEKVLQAMHSPFEFDGLVLNIGASIGLAVGVQGQEGWLELVSRADKMLYKAKAGGRGRHAG